jgi:hypothetical protein
VPHRAAISAILLTCALALAGCMFNSSPPRILRNPATGATVDCGSLSAWNWDNAAQERNCVAAYQRDGWKMQ